MKKYVLFALVALFSVLSVGTIVRAQTADTTPPTVSITSPAASQTISGTFTVTGMSSDNVGVTKIELFDGTSSLGLATGSMSPFTFMWDTTKVANGVHVLTADASDAAGNKTTSAAVGVIVNNSGKENNDGKGKMMFSVNPSGQAQVRGIVTANSNGVLTVQVWGVPVTVNTSGANISGVQSVSSIAVGDFVGVQGSINTTATTFTIDARLVKLRTAFTGHHDDSSDNGDNSQGGNHGNSGDHGKGKGNND